MKFTTQEIPTEKTVQVENVGLVTLKRLPRLTRMRITIKSAEDVFVSIPWKCSFSDGEKFFYDKSDWVLRTLQKMKQRGLVNKMIEPGELFETRNFRYCVAPSNCKNVKVQLQKEEKLVRIEFPSNLLPNSPEVQKKLKITINGVLHYEAKRFLLPRIADLANLLGYTYQRATLKNNKSNWGSCSSRKNINLNIQLMRLPDRVIDFVIVHELVHTKIPNHGSHFKTTMKRHFQDYEELEKTMKRYRPEIY